MNNNTLKNISILIPAILMTVLIVVLILILKENSNVIDTADILDNEEVIEESVDTNVVDNDEEIKYTNQDFQRPEKGEVVKLGSDLVIKWNPDTIKVTQVWLVPVSDYIGFNKIQIYSISSLNDPVYKDGVLIERLKEGLSLYPGEYKVLVHNYGNKNSLTSEVFTIESPVEFSVQRSDGGGIHQDSLGLTTQSDGFILELGIREENGTFASNTRGYSATLFILDEDGKRARDGIIEGKYLGHGDWGFKIEEFVFKTFDFYELNVWCSDFSYTSICAQKYGNDPSRASLKKNIDLTLFKDAEVYQSLEDLKNN